MKAIAFVIPTMLAACATVPAPAATTGTSTAGLGQTANVGPLLVRPIAVVEDSRCPANVQCVWAGRLVVRAEVSGGVWRQTRDLTLGDPQPIADGQITLVSGEPGKTAGSPTDPRAYRLTFNFQGGL